MPNPQSAKEQIAAMLQSKAGEAQAAASSEPPATTPPAVSPQEPTSTPPATTPPVVEPPAGEPAPAEPPKAGDKDTGGKEGTSTPPPEASEENVLEVLAGLLSTDEPVQPPAKEPTPAPTPPVEPATPPVTPTDVKPFQITPDLYQKAVDSPEGLAEVLNQFGQHLTGVIRSTAVKDAVASGIKGVQDEIPLTVAAEVFWAQNPDLLNFAPIVSKLATRIYAAQPELRVSQVYSQAGKEARVLIQKLASKVQPTGNQATAPNFVPTPAGARPANGGSEGLTPVQKEIMELLNLNK